MQCSVQSWTFMQVVNLHNSLSAPTSPLWENMLIVEATLHYCGNGDNASAVNSDDDLVQELTLVGKVRLEERCILGFCCLQPFFQSWKCTVEKSLSPPMNSIWRCPPLTSNRLHQREFCERDIFGPELNSAKFLSTVVNFSLLPSSLPLVSSEAQENWYTA